jgi:hypothetical protein
MSEIIKILIVEDTASDIQSYQDSIKTVNLELLPNCEIQAEFCKTKEEGLRAIYEMKDDLSGAFIDLKLNSGAPVDENDGNELVASIYGKLRFPVIVLTNTPGAFDAKFPKSSFLEVLTKTDVQYNDILKRIVAIHRTGITPILGGKGKIEKMLSDIFWKHISETLPAFVVQKQTTPEWDVEKVLLRYISAHILEYLEVSIENNFEAFSVIEFYIKPSVKGKIFTGDIVKDKHSGNFLIVLTPACDLATDVKRPKPKAEYVTVAWIEEIEKIEKDRNSGDVKRLKSNSHDLKYHYLPKTPLFKGGYVNFQNLSGIPVSEFENNKSFEIECIVTNPFRKDIVSRFSNYYSRQGQPALE